MQQATKLKWRSGVVGMTLGEVGSQTSCWLWLRGRSWWLSWWRLDDGGGSSRWRHYINRKTRNTLQRWDLHSETSCWYTEDVSNVSRTPQSGHSSSWYCVSSFLPIPFSMLTDGLATSQWPVILSWMGWPCPKWGDHADDLCPWQDSAGVAPWISSYGSVGFVPFVVVCLHVCSKWAS